jgi:hypothetical protein
MGLAGVLLGLGLLVWLAYRGWSVLLLAPLAALVAAAFAGEPLLASWTQTFMGSAAQFVAQFFPLFLLGALFGKLMEDSGAVDAIATVMTDKLGAQRAVLAVVLAGAKAGMAATTAPDSDDPPCRRATTSTEHWGAPGSAALRGWSLQLVRARGTSRTGRYGRRARVGLRRRPPADRGGAERM